VSENQGSAER